MDRNKVLAELNSYIQSVEKDTTMILQSLQWDKKHLFENPQLALCRYDRHHRMPRSALAEHEARCVLRSDGYSLQDELLPDPPYSARHLLVKLGDADIQKIINDAAKSDPLFKRVTPTQLRILTIYINKQSRPRPGPSVKRTSRLQPCSPSRLVAMYSRDERRAIHDAVVANAPKHEGTQDCCDLTMGLPDSTKDVDRAKTREEMLALERDMRRRRVKYRGTVKSTNYSHTLREVIATQMEMYTDVNIKVEKADDDVQSITTNTNREPIPSQSPHNSYSHRGDNNTKHDNYGRKGDKYRRNRNADHEISTNSTHRETKHSNDKRNSYNTGDDCSNRRRGEYDSKDKKTEKSKGSSDSRYSHDRERSKTSDRRNERHDDKYQQSYDNDRESSTKHRVRINKYSDYGDRYRNSSDKHNNVTINIYTNKSEDKYRDDKKRHRSGRSDSRSERKKSSRSYDYDTVKVKKEPSDDNLCGPKRKRSEHH